MDVGHEYIPNNFSSPLTIKLTFHFVQGSANFTETGDGLDGTDGIDGLQGVTGYTIASELVEAINYLIELENVPNTLSEAFGYNLEVIPYKFKFELKDVYFPSGTISHDNASINIRMHSSSGVTISTVDSQTIVPECTNQNFLKPNFNSNNQFYGSASYCNNESAQIQNWWYIYKYYVAQFKNFEICEYMDENWQIFYTWRIQEVARMIWHEISHNFGLQHTVHKGNGQVTTVDNDPLSGTSPFFNYALDSTIKDYCSDTPSIDELLVSFSGCHPADATANGNGSDCGACDNIPTGCASNYTCSSNLMDYCRTTNGRALTPEQLGRFYYHLYKDSDLLNAVKVDHCVVDEEFDIIIDNEKLTWESDRILKGNVTVNDNAILTVKCQLYMPEDSRIIVKPGGKLILDGGCVSTRCGSLWLGIEVWGNDVAVQNSNNQGVVELKRVQ